MAPTPDDPFWPPPPEEVEQVVVGESPYVLLQVVQGPIPGPGVQALSVLEIHSGGGVGMEHLAELLRCVLDALEVGDLGVTSRGALVYRTEAPPGGLNPG